MNFLNKKVYKIIFFVFVIALMLVPVVPKEFQNFMHFLGLNDKAEHVIAFFLLSLLLNRASNTSIHRLRNIVALLSFGFVIEAVQMFIPGRSATFADFMANVFGILIFQVLFSIYLFLKKRKK